MHSRANIRLLANDTSRQNGKEENGNFYGLGEPNFPGPVLKFRSSKWGPKIEKICVQFSPFRLNNPVLIKLGIVFLGLGEGRGPDSQG